MLHELQGEEWVMNMITFQIKCEKCGYMFNEVIKNITGDATVSKEMECVKCGHRMVLSIMVHLKQG